MDRSKVLSFPATFLRNLVLNKFSFFYWENSITFGLSLFWFFDPAGIVSIFRTLCFSRKEQRKIFSVRVFVQHPLHSWQARFLCKDSDLFWDSVYTAASVFTYCVLLGRGGGVLFSLKRLTALFDNYSISQWTQPPLLAVNKQNPAANVGSWMSSLYCSTCSHLLKVL